MEKAKEEEREEAREGIGMSVADQARAASLYLQAEDRRMQAAKYERADAIAVEQLEMATYGTWGRPESKGGSRVAIV